MCVSVETEGRLSGLGKARAKAQKQKGTHRTASSTARLGRNDQRSSWLQRQAIRGYIACREFKTIIKLIDFYHHD